MNKYTDERNIQMLIFLLKKYNIKKIIISPGAMNISFVNSVQNDDFFELYSCVDERSACYMACGLAEESREPVALSCTGATSSRNYIPGLTEAFYRKLPILAITSAQFRGNIGHNIPQMIDRQQQLNDIVKLSVQIPMINNKNDEWLCNIELNKALLELTHNGNGPVHINIETSYSTYFTANELPTFRKINRFNEHDRLPKIEVNKVGIFIGSHSKMTEELTNEIECFCEKYNAVVLCDRTSNYFGKFKVMANIITDQDNYNSKINNFNLIIHLGNISGSYMKFKTKNVWRIDIGGKIIDTFKKLENVFEMDELVFFKTYNNMKENKIKNDFYTEWMSEYNKLTKKSYDIELPFSNLWIAKTMLDYIPDKSVLHLGILNSLRSWNYFDNGKTIYGYSNTGGFGIDGIVSTIIGASFANKNKIYYAVLGDLAFFYDMNSLGNHYIGNNIRLVVINNGCGTEFHNYNHAAQSAKDKIGNFIAADGHFGFKSKKLLKDYSQSLGFEYISASNKEDFIKNIKYFTSNEMHDKSIIFEVFTNSNEESDALKKIRNLETSPNAKIKNEIKKYLSPNTKRRIKKLLNK